MKKFLRFCGSALSALFLCTPSHAAAGGQISVDTFLPIPAEVSYSSTWSVRTDGMNWASAETVVTSVTATGGNFTDGQTSTGNFTVSGFAALSSATATGKLTVVSDAGLTGACISGGGPGLGVFNVCNPANFATGSLGGDCINIAAAINATGVLVSTCPTASTTIIYASAPVYGLNYNQFSLNVSSYMAINVATLISSTVFQTGYATMSGVGYGTLTGGQNNATVQVNGVTLTANNQWFPITSNAATATSLATAITNSSTTSNVIASAGNVGVVFATSTIIGTVTNGYALVTSTDGALESFGNGVETCDAVNNVCSAFMTGGMNSGYVVGTSTITIVGNNFANGQQVYFSTGSNVALPGLIWGTTYFVIEIPQTNSGGSSFMLSATSTGAISGAYTPVVLTTSATKTTADIFSVLPSASGLTGTPKLQWVVSDDNLNWVPLSTTTFGQALNSAGYGTFYSSGTVVMNDFGHVHYGWLGLSITAPATGAINATARITGKQN